MLAGGRKEERGQQTSLPSSFLTLTLDIGGGGGGDNGETLTYNYYPVFFSLSAATLFASLHFLPPFPPLDHSIGKEGGEELLYLCSLLRYFLWEGERGRGLIIYAFGEKEGREGDLFSASSLSLSDGKQ